MKKKKKNKKDPVIFDIENWLWKSDFALFQHRHISKFFSKNEIARVYPWYITPACKKVDLIWTKFGHANYYGYLITHFYQLARQIHKIEAILEYAII